MSKKSINSRLLFSSRIANRTASSGCTFVNFIFRPRQLFHQWKANHAVSRTDRSNFSRSNYARSILLIFHVSLKEWENKCCQWRYIEHASRVVMSMRTADEPKMMDEKLLPWDRLWIMQALQASWLRCGWIGERKIERWITLLMRNEMSVKSFRRQVMKRTIMQKPLYKN